MAEFNPTYICNPDVIYRELGDECVLLHLKTGKYYGLNPVGLRMWQLILEKGDLEQVIQAMLDEYEVEPDQLRSDLLVLVEALEKNELLSRSQG